VLLFLAPYLRLYGLSFLFAGVNILFYYLLRSYFTSKNKKIFFGIIVCVAVLFIVEYAPLSKNSAGNTKRVGIIALQGDNPFMFGYTEDYFKHSGDVYKQGLAEGLQKHPDAQIVVAPESSQFVRTLSRLEKKSPQSIGMELLPNDQYRTLIYGDYDDARNASLVVALSNDPTEEQKESEKLLLMPLGEYQPYVVEFTAWLLGKKEWLADLLFYRNLRLPKESQGTLATQVGSFSAVSCSEVFAGITYRHIKKVDPDFIVHLQRLASFHGNTQVFNEGIRVSKFRAAELQKPIIGAVDGSGFSYIINSRGEVVSMGNKDSLFVYGEIEIKK
jgi:apolipoprotein N-acyltransferase